MNEKDLGRRNYIVTFACFVYVANYAMPTLVVSSSYAFAMSNPLMRMSLFPYMPIASAISLSAAVATCLIAAKASRLESKERFNSITVWAKASGVVISVAHLLPVLMKGTTYLLSRIM